METLLDESFEEGIELFVENNSGPFDLLLELIAKRQLDLTEVALSTITDEFLEIVCSQDGWDLDEASQFLLVAATLLELKAARIIPQPEEDLNEETLRLLEARDILFARLIQYKAYKEVAEGLGIRYSQNEGSVARDVLPEPKLLSALPELVWNTSATELAQIAALVFSQPSLQIDIPTTHLHHTQVPLWQEAKVLESKFSKKADLTFAELIADAPSKAHVICRFLVILEFFRQDQVVFSQSRPLEEIRISWIS